MRTIGLTVLTLALTLWFATGARAGKRVALVVGNSAYTEISALANPKNDAELMAATLRKLGFEVVTALDADRRTMGRAIRKFGKSLRFAGKDAVGLFYFAGHGIQARGTNFLLPVGAIVEDHADLEIEALSASNILAQMDSAGNALNLIILDACRNNPFKGAFRSAGRGLARITAASGSLVAFAAAPGQVAADGRGKHSPFTAALVDAMQQPGLAVEQVFKRVRVRVERETGGRQTPWEESSLRGDFYFTEKAAPLPVPKIDKSAEITFWNTIQDSGDVRLFEIYMMQYPGGLFAPLAGTTITRLKADKERKRAETKAEKNRVEEQKRKAEKAKRLAEEQARMEAQRKAAEAADRRATELAYWNTVKSSGNPVLLQSYVERYPDGAFSGLAQIMIEQARRRLEQEKRKPAEEVQVAAIEPEKVVAPEIKPEDDADLPRKLQSALARVGCNPGKVDGQWGRNSRTALDRFAKYSKLTLPDEPLSAETLSLLEGLDARVCPLACNRRQIEKNGACVTKTCPAGLELNSAGQCRVKQKQQATKPVTTTNSDAGCGWCYGNSSLSGKPVKICGLAYKRVRRMANRCQ